MKRASLLDIFFINAYWIGLSFMWNSLHVIILPAVLLHLVPGAQKNTYLGLLTFFGLVIAMIVQPVSGALSDRWVSAWGRRRPLILFGTLFDLVFLSFLGWAGGLGWLAVGYLGLQLSSNLAHGPLQGLMPDRVPPEQMGRASGFKNMTDMVGMIVSSLLVGRLLSPETRQPVGVVGLVAAVLAATAALTLFGSREDPQPGKRSSLGALLRTAWQEAFQIDLRLHAGYGWLIASRLLFLTGIYGIQSFAQYYVQDVLAVPNPIQVTGDLLAAIVLALTGMALLGGWLGDRVGHRQMQWAASAIAFVGSLLMLWARTPGTLLAFGGILGAGLGLFLTSNWALLNELAPREQTGKFLGLTNLATGGAAALARLEGPMIDLLNQARPEAWWGYTALFLLGAVGIAASAVLLVKVTEPQAVLREVPSTPPGQPAP